MKYSIIVVILMLTSCFRAPQLFVVNYQFIDIPAEKCIELKFKNNLPYTVCLTPEMWPNKPIGGRLASSGDRCFLVINGERFPLVKSNPEYCPYCANIVDPGETITAWIPYADFGLPETLFHSEKHLEFSPTAFKCSHRLEKKRMGPGPKL